jgi:DNA polymerase
MLDAMGITVWLERGGAEAGSTRSGDTPTEPGPQPEQATGGPDVAGMDWGALEYAVSNCTRCRLHRTRTRTVFGIGHRRADWMIVGEGPGQQEDRRGEPFVGPAGSLLDLMLKAAGRARGDVYITNIVKCRPPGNHDPTPGEAGRCADYLDRQIELTSPRLIIAVGKVAANNLLGVDTPLGRLRGIAHRHPRFGTPIIVTYHPAYLLRDASAKRKSWADLKLAMRESRAAR